MDSRPVAVQLPVAKAVYLPTSMDHCCTNQVFDAVDRCSTTNLKTNETRLNFMAASRKRELFPPVEEENRKASIKKGNKNKDGKDGMHFRYVRTRPWGSYSAEIRDPGEKRRVRLGTFDTAEEAEGFEELGMDPEDTGLISDWLRRYSRKGSEELGMDPQNRSIISDLVRFVKEKESYKKAGKAWKRLYFFYNTPDSKSLIDAMANYLEFGTCVLNPTFLLSWSELRMTNMLTFIPNRSLIQIPDFDHRLRDFNTVELKGSCLLEFVHGLVSSCGDEQIIVFATDNRDLHDAALQHPFNEYVYIHKSSRRPDEGDIVKEGENVDEGEIVDGGESVQFDIIKQKPLVDVDLNFPSVEEKIRNPEIKKKGDCYQSPSASASSTVTHDKSSSWKGFEELGMDPENTGIISVSSKFESGKNREQKPLVDFDSTNNRAFQSYLLVEDFEYFFPLAKEKRRAEEEEKRRAKEEKKRSFLKSLFEKAGPLPLYNSDKTNAKEASKGTCMTEGVPSLVDSTTRISSTDFDAPDNGACLVRANQSGPIMLNSEKNDTSEGLIGECLTESVLGLDDSTNRKSFPDFAAENKAHLVRPYQSGPVVSLSENQNRGEASKRECITKSIYGLEDLQQHCGGRPDAAAKSFRAIYDPVFHTPDSIARKSFEVLETLPAKKQPNDGVPLLLPGRLTLEVCVQKEKSPDLPRVMQFNGVEQRVTKMPRYLGGSTAQSTSSSCGPIGLPDGGHIVLRDALDQSTFYIEHVATADQCSPTLSLPEKKMARKTLNRNCRTMSVIFEEKHQRFVRRCEGASKSLGAMCISRKHGINQVSMVELIHKQRGIHQWPFLRSAVGLLDGGHILSLLEKKIVRKTLKRKCRSMSVLSLEDHKQHVDRRWEDAAKSHGAKCICRQLVIHRLSTAKCIHKELGIHQWPFQRSTIGVPDGGHILPLSEKKIVRTTLKRKCRSMSVLSLVDRQQHVDRRWEDAAKNIGAKRIRRQLVMHRVSIAKRICRQHGVHHRWSFKQSAIGLPDGGHILPLSGKKIVRKTLKRKCRSMSVIRLVDRQQHVDRRWEDAAKNIGAKRICRQLVNHRVSITKRICRQHGIHHRWPFQQSAIGLPDGGHILPLSEKKIVRKTLKRKCRSMSVLSLVDRQQHVDRRWKDATKNIGAKRICKQLMIHHVSIAKHICGQHGIHHRWPFERAQGWETMKGYSLGDKRPVEVICLSIDGKLVSRLRRIYISWLGRFSPRPSALPRGGLIEGPIALSSSEFAATNNLAQRVGQDQRCSGASGYENERTREQEDPEEIRTSITKDDLLQLHGRMTRKDAAAILHVSVSTVKRKCQEYKIGLWKNGGRKRVCRPPDQHGERNTSTARETPSHNVQTGIEGVPVGQNEEANEFRPDFTEGSIPSNTENGLILGSSFGFPLPQLTSMPSENMGGSIDLRNSLANLTFATCSDQAAPSQHVQGQSMHPTVYPDHNVFPPTQIASSQEPFSEVMIKAFYRDADNTIIKFLFPLTSGIVDLKKEVSKRLNVEVDRFVVKYKDKYEDLISILCNEDLILYLLSSLGNDEIRVLVHDKVGGTPNFCEKCRSSMQTRA